MEMSSQCWGVLEMKSLAHGVALVAVVLVSTWCLLVQVAHVDEAWSGIGGRPGSAAVR